ncbi:hypothetical protein LI064_02835 [Clostridium perfringens]|uniref:hypothetical protein n=1 Tax=Clostridium perfringens TaxID=1502 RepID=UPI002247378E|nr:hypothetical protein [Clostridium perfringens]MCX0353458.1 hypothetical protein [Clostridium perfringens]
MNFYYFNNNTDTNGNHEVHCETCHFLPDKANRTCIGYLSNCKEAMSAAQSTYPSKSFDGCYWCCEDCHKW